MKVSELKGRLETVPDDAEVAYGVYQGWYYANRKPCLIISFKSGGGFSDSFVDIPEYHDTIPRYRLLSELNS